MTKQTSGFVGFPDRKMKPVIVPDYFFSDLLPQIDDLAELKLTLHCFWLLNEQDGALRYLRGSDLRSDRTLLDSLRQISDLRPVHTILDGALERAVARNTLLRLQITTEADGARRVEPPPTPHAETPQRADADSERTAPEDGAAESSVTEDWYFMNTVKGRETLAKIRQGRLEEVLAAIPDEARLQVDRPNVFVLYEQNIGVMTPLIADQLRDMEKTYAPAWLEEAFEIAVSNNKRNLKYIQAILKRWETEGKNTVGNDAKRHEEPGRNPAQRRNKKYTIPDEYADIIIG